MDNIRGAVLMVLAMLGFALEDMFIKLLADALPIGQILLMLGIGGTVVFGAIVLAQGKPLFTRQMFTWPILARVLGELFGAMTFVSAIVLTPISSASAILQATPLVVTLGAAVFLGEPVGWRRWSAIIVGLIGVLMIIRPGMASFEMLSLLALIAVFALAMRDLSTRKIPASVTSMQLSFLGFVSVLPAGLFLLAFTGESLLAPSGVEWAKIISAITVGLFAYYAIVAAMRVGDVGFVTPFRYARLLFALVAGVMVFDESPDTLTLLGAAIIVASGIYTVLRERKIRHPK
ncbi:MAG: drug/metabolite transporter (DMT)-like permease [Sulfitobacter sp.]|jgi:drug/metabolite transporter (DMT)-like permease